MFLNSHLRLAIPSTLGQVVVFDTTEDPATHVPDFIAFMNDGDIDVTLNFDAGLNKAQVLSTADGSGNYNTGTNKNLLISIDGETAVAITVTSGASESRAQMVTDINAAFAAAGGNTALAKCGLSGSKYLTITSGTTGSTSSVQIEVPATLNANAVLGFAVGTYTAENSFQLGIVSPIVINPKANAMFVNPRPGAPLLQIRGQVHDGTTGLGAVIDATPLFRYNGVQQ